MKMDFYARIGNKKNVSTGKNLKNYMHSQKRLVFWILPL